MPKKTNLLVCVVTSFLLVACGGAGGSSKSASTACSTQSTFNISVAWTSASPTVSNPNYPLFGINSGLTGEVGSPFSATPIVSGVPASCVSSMTFSALALPAGLAINQSTGEITGIPTAANVVSSTVAQSNMTTVPIADDSTLNVNLQGYSDLPTIIQIAIYPAGT